MIIYLRPNTRELYPVKELNELYKHDSLLPKYRDKNLDYWLNAMITNGKIICTTTEELACGIAAN